ncbi:MAG: sugar ABC transporter ATP-binding protein [Clostridia bacterium]
MNDTVLEAKQICKSFGSVRVLENVNFDIRKGEIHALIGENGAGKSTIIKIISGVYTKDGGQLLLDGKERVFSTPKEAMDAGIRVIHQEINMVNTLTVAENIFLGSYPRAKNGAIDWKTMFADAEQALEVLGGRIDVKQKVSKLSIAKQQMIEIAKALSVEPKVLIMDEPTAALNDQETEQLFELLESLKRRGVSIIYITHRFSELYRLADRVTVLRDGENVATIEATQLDNDTLISMMVGENKVAKYSKKVIEKGEVIFQVEGLSIPGKLENINLSICRGEIAVVFGLVGAGQTELCRAIFGDLAYTQGKMWLNGQELKLHGIRQACKAHIGYVSDDRKNEGIIPLMSIKENVCLTAYMDKLKNRLGFVKRLDAKAIVQMLHDKLKIKSAGLSQKISALSGGNQQKTMICRWLANDVKFLVLNMPTRGVDVGARAEIYRALEDLVEQGVAVLIISPEMPEVLSIADTVTVMHEGRITGTLAREDATQEELMKLALEIA